MIKGVTLRGLEVFEILASTGSVAKTSVFTGLSQPAVSQQLRNLETALGADLIDHTRRPMRLTHTGQSFLKRVSTALTELRRAQNEVSVLDLSQIDQVNIGIIDLFENDISAQLLHELGQLFPNSVLRMQAARSAELMARLKSKDLHIAVASSTGTAPDGIDEYPLVSDPLIAITPQSMTLDWNAMPGELPDLPLLRAPGSSTTQQKIDAMLEANGINFPARYEFDRQAPMLAMIARGRGWTINTALTWARDRTLHGALRPSPLPFDAPPRTISLFVSAEWSGNAHLDISRVMREMIETHMIAPLQAKLPWIGAEAMLLGT